MKIKRILQWKRVRKAGLNGLFEPNELCRVYVDEYQS